MAGDDHRNWIGAERVADRPGGARVAHTSREGRVGVDVAERDAQGLREHAGLEGGHARQVDRDGEERPAAGQVLTQLLSRALGVGRARADTP